MAPDGTAMPGVQATRSHERSWDGLLAPQLCPRGGPGIGVQHLAGCPAPFLAPQPTVVPLLWAQHRPTSPTGAAWAGGCRGAVSGGRELIPSGMPQAGAEGPPPAWAPAALGFRAAAAPEQRQGQMAQGWPRLGCGSRGFGRAPRPCPGRGCRRPCGQRGGTGPARGLCWWLGAPQRWVAGWHPPGTAGRTLGGSGELCPSVPRCQPGREASAQVVAPRAASHLCWERVGGAFLGAAGCSGTGLSCGMWDVQDRAKGRAGFLRHKIPGKAAGGLGLAASCRGAASAAPARPSPSRERPELPQAAEPPVGVLGTLDPAPMGGGVPGGASPCSPGLSPGIAWPRCGGAAPAGVCTAHTLPVSEDCRELCKHGRAPCVTAPRGESRFPRQLLGSPGPRAAAWGHGCHSPGRGSDPSCCTAIGAAIPKGAFGD